ncbi:MAG: aminoacyl-tRNA hydrolase [Fusobacteriaceae bacterium]
MKLIVGLGNPGEKYMRTRHNIGFDIVDILVHEVGGSTYREKFQGLISEKEIRTENNYSEKVYFLKPQTFMNLSGDSISAATNFYKINTQDIIIIYDDMALPLGKIRIKDKGSSGGHNGMKSIIAHLGENFPRLRCGIGSPPPAEKGSVDFVLGRFRKEEQEFVDKMSDDSVEALKDFINNMSLENLMQKYNGK